MLCIVLLDAYFFRYIILNLNKLTLQYTYVQQQIE